MNDDNEDEELEASDSKCWTCKFGMCLQDKDLQTFFQPGVVEGNGFEGPPEQPGMTQVSFVLDKVRSVCFWRPDGVNQMIAPVVFNLVEKCSRYEKNKFS